MDGWGGQTVGWINGWMDRWVNGWMDEYVSEWINGQVDEETGDSRVPV